MKMPVAMTLTGGGLILVVTPCLLNLIFVVLLALDLKDYDNLIRRDIATKKIGPALTAVSAQLAEFDIAASIRPIPKARYDKDKLLLETRLKELDQLSMGDPARVKRAKDIREGINKAIDLIDKTIAGKKLGQISTDAAADLNEGLGDSFNDIDGALSEEDQNKANANYGALAEQLQWHIRNLLALSVLLNVALACLLFIYFFNTVSAQFRGLLTNTKRLTNREPLPASVKGVDELAQIDMQLHKMAGKVMQVDQQRRQLVGLVRQGMKEPISAVHQILTKAGEAQSEIPGKAKLRLSYANNDAENLLKMVNTLLDIQAIDSGRFELNLTRVSAIDLVEGALAQVEALAAARGVRISCAPPPLTLVADPARISQVLANLLNNAIKYSPKGSTVSIELVDNDQYTEIRVSDEGCGVTTQTQDQIFARSKRDYASTTFTKGGLGLAICKAIVEQHGGSIGLDSVEGAGSCFWFRIPTSKRAA